MAISIYENRRNLWILLLEPRMPPGPSLAPFARIPLHTLRLRRHFSLACSARIRHNPRQRNTPDEAVTNELEPCMGRTNVVGSK